MKKRALVGDERKSQGTPLLINLKDEQHSSTTACYRRTRKEVSEKVHKER